MGDLKLFMTSVSSSSEVKGRIARIQMILESKKIDFQKVDISLNEDDKKKMRCVACNEKCAPPQLARGDEYLGDYDQFMDAVEAENLHGFLKLDTPCQQAS